MKNSEGGRGEGGIANRTLWILGTTTTGSVGGSVLAAARGHGGRVKTGHSKKMERGPESKTGPSRRWGVRKKFKVQKCGSDRESTVSGKIAIGSGKTRGGTPRERTAATAKGGGKTRGKTKIPP